MIVQELMFESFYDLNESMCNFNKGYMPDSWIGRRLKKRMQKMYSVMLKTIEDLERIEK